MIIETINFIKEYILGFFVLISVLVFVHEYGHYIFAKMFKVKVESFSIGFGRELFGWTDKAGTRWKICPIPFGGYVKMKGEMIENENSATEHDEDAFQAKALWQKFLIVFAGPLFNLIFPIFILFFIAFFSGVSTLVPKIDKVLETSNAYSILKSGDIILEANSIKIKDWTDFQKTISLNPNQNIDLKVLRDSKELNLQVKVSAREERGYKVGFLGVSASMEGLQSHRYSLVRSVSYAYNTYIDVITLMVKGLGRLFIGQVSLDEIGGPIKIAELSGDSLKRGVDSWMFFMSLLSLNLAIINLLPIPALDGGHLLLYLVQGITRKKISFKVQSFLMQIGFMFLIALMVLVVFKDIFSFILK
ncbi:MAG: RIP metalloprotease RseP [Alphaproteobacteria bacterium]|jgi:regulator of sigma E protease|nr:RIP metalloprotease RseP [Alphaproteobacteria bacterium]